MVVDMVPGREVARVKAKAKEASSVTVVVSLGTLPPIAGPILLMHPMPTRSRRSRRLELRAVKEVKGVRVARVVSAEMKMLMPS